MIIVFSPMLRITNHPKCSRQYLKYTNEDKIYILCRLILLWLTSLLHMKGNRYLENFSFFHSNCICLHLVVTGCRLHDAFYEPWCDYSLQETDKEGRLFPPYSINWSWTSSSSNVKVSHIPIERICWNNPNFSCKTRIHFPLIAFDLSKFIFKKIFFLIFIDGLYFTSSLQST